MAITLTERAATRVAGFLAKRGKGVAYVKDECGCGESFNV